MIGESFQELKFSGLKTNKDNNKALEYQKLE